MNKSLWRHVKSQEELHEALARQIKHLRRSADAYDKGALEEAERLAGTAYILLHDGSKNSKSLLGQINIKTAMEFIDSTQPQFKNPDLISAAALPLCAIEIRSEAGDELPSLQYVPLLETLAPESREQTFPFSKWYDQVIYSNSRGLKLTRKNVIHALRFQDGAGHVDDHIRSEFEAYHWLAQEADGTIFMRFSGDKSSSGPIRNAHWATMRQIAWELDEALKAVGF